MRVVSLPLWAQTHIFGEPLRPIAESPLRSSSRQTQIPDVAIVDSETALVQSPRTSIGLRYGLLQLILIRLRR